MILVTFSFQWLERPFDETLWLSRHLSNAGDMPLVSDSFHSVWLHNPRQEDLGQWKWNASGDERGLMRMSTVYTCWSNNKPAEQRTLTCDSTTLGYGTILITYCFFSPPGFKEPCLLTWSTDGADSEPDWSFTMGLQNIWRKGLQEGHNCIKGTSQQPLCCWARSYLIKPYPLFLSKHSL